MARARPPPAAARCARRSHRPGRRRSPRRSVCSRVRRRVARLALVERRFRPLHLLLLTLVLAELILTGGWRPALILYPLVGFAFLRLRAPRLRKRAAAGRELNAELARQLRLPPVAVRMPGQAFFRPGSRFRRRFVLSLVLVLAGALALAVAATAWTIRENHRWAKRANPICAREHARLAALRDRQLDPIA